MAFKKTSKTPLISITLVKLLDAILWPYSKYEFFIHAFGTFGKRWIGMNWEISKYCAHIFQEEPTQTAKIQKKMFWEMHFKDKTQKYIP